MLDVARSRYYAVDENTSAGLATLVRDWPVSPCAEIARQEQEEARTFAESLFAQGILTNSTRDMDARRLPSVIPAREQLFDWNLSDIPKIGGADLARFASSAIRASFLLRFSSLGMIVNDVSARKGRLRRPKTELPVERELAGIFRGLRTFAYSAPDRCLYDSLVLTYFLLAHHFSPTWVIGVKLQPFSAHSWVQDGPYVLNGTPDYVRQFTPILAV